MKFHKILILIIVFVLLGYVFFIRNTQVQKNAKLILPQEDKFLKFAKDTVHYKYISSPYKVVIFIPKSECLSCKFHADEWNTLISQVDSIMSSKVRFVFILEPIYDRAIYVYLKSHNFQLPVFVDNKNWFRKVNCINDFFLHIWILKDNHIEKIINLRNRQEIIDGKLLNLIMKSVYN